MLCQGFIIKSNNGHFIGLHGKSLKKVSANNTYIFTNLDSAKKALKHLSASEYSIYGAALIVKERSIE